MEKVYFEDNVQVSDIGGGGVSGDPRGQSHLAPSSQDYLLPSPPQSAHPHLAIPLTAAEEEIQVGALPFSYATEETEIVDPEIRRVFHYSTMFFPNGSRSNMMPRHATDQNRFNCEGKSKYVSEGPAQAFIQHIYPARKYFENVDTQHKLLAAVAAKQTKTKRVAATPPHPSPDLARVLTYMATGRRIRNFRYARLQVLPDK